MAALLMDRKPQILAPLSAMGIGGMFANSIRKALNTAVPKKLWPKIKKRLRFAFNQRGAVDFIVFDGFELVEESLLLQEA
ncbi:unnamed protein product [Gongylonema pulchrum]|uniref:Magnesium chelatase n=1 Tax=Gongylonema pulchrum TaxID=637853 RepID=A0A183EK03_9BILA|nr:unnamed protein product [Gongylonema pulchrum]